MTCHLEYFDLFTGLIVGAVIKYTSALPKKVTKETVVDLNASGDWSGPPDYVRLKVPFEYNDTHTVKYYHYAFASHVQHEEPLEPELEEKASCCFCLYAAHGCMIYYVCTFLYFVALCQFCEHVIYRAIHSIAGY